MLCVFTLSVALAQTSDSTSNEETAIEKTLDSSDFDSYFSDDGTLTSGNTRGGAATFFLFLRMLVVLAIVIGCIYVVMWFMKRNMKTEQNDDKFLRQVASVNVAPGKTVQVVTLLDKKALVIGVSDDGINLLSEFENPDAKPEDYKELIQAMNLYADSQKNVQRPKNFADILEIFMPNGPKDYKKGSSSGIFSDLLNRNKGGEE